MLRDVNDSIFGRAIRATDGVIGEVDDLYFDDEDWAIRYLVVDTGTWLSARKVLISPFAMGDPDWARRELPASLTKAQVERSPDIDTRKPVSRQHEAAYLGYYGYPYYWGGGGIWGMGAYPGSPTVERRFEEEMKTRATPASRSDDCHLRSCKAITGYHIHATDGDVGHVEDFILDEHTWEIRYLVVNTSNWWVGHRMLVAPQWIESVQWADEKIVVDLTRQAIKHAPPYHPGAQLGREQEHAIYSHHGRSEYWTRHATRDSAAPSAR